MIKAMIGKRLVTFFITLSLVTSAFYLPVFTPRTHAIFGFGDLVIDIKALAERIVDGFAMVAAQKMVDDMVKSTVDWAQTGFEGNPAYVTDQNQYFTNLADGIAGEFIAGSDLAGLCSPFQAQIRLSLQRAYTQQRSQFQCTLTDVIANIEGFYDNFNEGGWDAWFSMTQNDSNNPYGAFLSAQVELDSRIAAAVGLQREQLSWNQGFLSWSECIVPDPLTGECLRRGPVKTPGTTIKAQLDQVLPSGLEKLISVEHVDQLVSAFANGLLTRYVFGPKGLFNGNNSGDPPPGGPPISNFQEPSLCDVSQDIPGFNLDENCNPIPITNDEEDGGGDPNAICATDEEIEQFLIDNPGDDSRLSSAFPCN